LVRAVPELDFARFDCERLPPWGPCSLEGAVGILTVGG
jgi:hypothetical protein